MYVERQGSKLRVHLQELLHKILSMKKSLKFFSLRNVSILEQLLFEETVLRKTADNYFMFNQGSVGTKIVLGYSGKPNELINIDLAKRYVPLINHFYQLIGTETAELIVKLSSSTLRCHVVLTQFEALLTHIHLFL